MDNGTSTSCSHLSDFTMDDLNKMKEVLEKIALPGDDDDTVIIYVRGVCYTGKLTEGPLGQILKGKTPKGEDFALIVFKPLFDMLQEVKG